MQDVDINLYRALARRKSSEEVNTVFNYVQACVAVVDGRFPEYLNQVHPKFMKSVSSKSVYRVPFTTNYRKGQLYLPVALLFHVSTQYYYGNYNDPIRKSAIVQQGFHHHRNMIHTMVANNQIITTAKPKHRMVYKTFRMLVSPLRISIMIQMMTQQIPPPRTVIKMKYLMMKFHL